MNALIINKSQVKATFTSHEKNEQITLGYYYNLFLLRE